VEVEGCDLNHLRLQKGGAHVVFDPHQTRLEDVFVVVTRKETALVFCRAYLKYKSMANWHKLFRVFVMNVQI